MRHAFEKQTIKVQTLRWLIKQTPYNMARPFRQYGIVIVVDVELYIYMCVAFKP